MPDDPGTVAEGWFNLLAFLSVDCLRSSWPKLGVPLSERGGQDVNSAAREVLTDWIGRSANIRQFSMSPSVVSARADDFLEHLGRKLDRVPHSRLLKWMSFFFLSGDGRRDILDRWAFNLAFVQAQCAAIEAPPQSGTVDAWTWKVAQAPLVDVVPSILGAESQWDRRLVSFVENANDFAATIQGYARRMRLLYWWGEVVTSSFDRARLIEILASTGMPLDEVGEDADLLERLGLLENGGGR